MLDRLRHAGFARSGVLRRTPSSVAFEGTAPREPGVYAFLVRGEVTYIGAAQRGLRNRVESYLRQQTQRRSTRPVHAALAIALESDDVEVLTVVPEDADWNGLPVNTIAGLEAGLIKALKPAWNRRGVTVLDVVEDLLRRGATLQTLMRATGQTAASCRSYIDQLRSLGRRVVLTAPTSWQLID